eukprot:TRINITY_DN6234_c0_g1_i2.p1 TRINITY_DN6234_c0_g1~~TRINITY_DN6234_c0_g1_i2.p1  ORF type:complete len:568 (-),score=68.13 TRINITY_DN6234_c0_g1_i2:483-2186(-)
MGNNPGIRMIRNRSNVYISTDDTEMLDELFEVLRGKCILRDYSKRYETLKMIGKGGNAKVYLVRRRKDGEEFAAKIFRKKDLEKGENAKETIINEIKLMRVINHEKLIKLYEVYELKETVCLIMEVLKGGSLLDRLESTREFGERSALLGIRQILEAVQYLHAMGIMHRDLKLMNILLASDAKEFDIKVVDLGLATFVEEKKYIFYKCGTPGYIAPEIFDVKMGDKYSEKCDLFSVGVIFYIMLTGEIPIKGDTYNKIVQCNRKCQIDFSILKDKKISFGCIDLAKRLLDKHPKSRISASEALEHPAFTKYLPQLLLKKRESVGDFIPDDESIASPPIQRVPATPPKAGDFFARSPALIAKEREIFQPNGDTSFVFNVPAFNGRVDTIDDSHLGGPSVFASMNTMETYTSLYQTTKTQSMFGGNNSVLNDRTPQSLQSNSLRARRSSQNNDMIKRALYNNMARTIEGDEVVNGSDEVVLIPFKKLRDRLNFIEMSKFSSDRQSQMVRFSTDATGSNADREESTRTFRVFKEPSEVKQDSFETGRKTLTQCILALEAMSQVKHPSKKF